MRTAVVPCAILVCFALGCAPTPPWSAQLTGPLAFVPEYAGTVIPNSSASAAPDPSTVQVLLFNLNVSDYCSAYVDGGWVGTVGNVLGVTVTSSTGGAVLPGSFPVQGGPSTDGGTVVGDYVHALNQLPAGGTFDSVSVSGTITLTDTSASYTGSFDVTMPDPNGPAGTSRLQGTFAAPQCSQLIANYLWIP